MISRLDELFQKHLARTITHPEQQELDALLADPANEAELKVLLGEQWAHFSPAAKSLTDKESRALLNQILKRNVKPRGLIPFTWLRGAAAAALLVTTALAYFLIINNRQSAQLPLAEKANQVTTPAGSKTRLELPDGSVVLLHTNSKILYGNDGFGKTNRNVQLTGEAYFDVVKNAKVPFVISTAHINITVKGTAFNVKAYPGDETIETTLVRGLIEVSTTEDPDRKILLKPQEKLVIPVTPALGDRDNNSNNTESLYQITKLKAEPEAIPEISWTKKQLVFDNETMASIAPKLESWYNTKIYFGDEEIKQRRFSGVIEQETIRETLNAMQLSYRFTYEIKDNELRISSR